MDTLASDAVVEDAEVQTEVTSLVTGQDALVEEDLLVEDVSIDGMCGVY
ncbi:MAG: mycofactocin precursor MftA [Acidimicrobiales bacterium]